MQSEKKNGCSELGGMFVVGNQLECGRFQKSWVSLCAFFRDAAQSGIGQTVGNTRSCAGDDADSRATAAVGVYAVGADVRQRDKGVDERLHLLPMCLLCFQLDVVFCCHQYADWSSKPVGVKPESSKLSKNNVALTITIITYIASRTPRI